MCNQSGAGKCKGCNSCAACSTACNTCTPQHSTHVGWIHNAIAGIVHIPSVVPATNISHAPGVGHFGGRKYKGCCLGIAVCLLCQQHQLHI